MYSVLIYLLPLFIISCNGQRVKITLMLPLDIMRFIGYNKFVLFVEVVNHFFIAKITL